MRPNSNNMTIDVSPTRHGDNGGNMATTISTPSPIQGADHSYAAEYGRATGPRSRCHQEWIARVPRLRLLVWPAVRLERQLVTTIGAPEIPRSRPTATTRLHDRRPGILPVSTKTSASCSFFSQEYQRRADPSPARARPACRRARTKWRLLAERRRERQPVPVRARLHDRTPCSAANTQRGFRTAACSEDSSQSPCISRPRCLTSTPGPCSGLAPYDSRARNAPLPAA